LAAPLVHDIAGEMFRPKTLFGVAARFVIPASAVVAKRLARLVMVLAVLCLAGCAIPFRVPVASAGHSITTSGDFILNNGARLPYRSWLPRQPPRAIVLALHGFNDSRDAWDVPAPAFTAAGIAIYAPDQAGFGLAPRRGFWPGSKRLVADARAMVTILHRRYPHTRLIVLGESMGGAAGLLLGAEGDAQVNGYVLIAPAVWGGRTMSPAVHLTANIADTFMPWLRLTGQAAHIAASDNLRALIAFSENPLTIHATSMASAAGLIRLMGRAQTACAKFAPRHALILYGGHDQLIPKHAMASCWRMIPRLNGITLAYYPPDYHLMLLDHERASPVRDIIAFILHPAQLLNSPAPAQATIFLAEH
jgi:acylglycerol lipase